ncbi:MAG: nitroreductase family protein [Anaerolineae bacterium]
METLEAIHSRRSVRAFTDEPVPEELLREVLQAAAGAASSGNIQPWGFVVVQDSHRLQALGALAPGIIGQPTAVVAICLDVERAERLGGALGPKLAWIDIGLATQNLLLAAHDLGLGACPIGSFHREATALFLDLPSSVQPVLLMALGYPRVKPASPGRRPLTEICFAERWGTPYE